MHIPHRLLILDVDHTLLHSYSAEAILDWLPPEDTNRSVEARIKHKALLLEKVPGAWECNDFVVCPRPHISQLEEYIVTQDDLGVAFFSTAAPIYLEMILPRLVPKLYERAMFVWGKDKCTRLNGLKFPIKDMQSVRNEFGLMYEQIWMVDDSPVVTPWYHWLEISPFNISTRIEPAHQDYQLLRLIMRMQLFLSRDRGIYTLRMNELHELKNWENMRTQWLTLNRRKGVTEADFPIPKPSPCDYVPDSWDAVKHLLQ